MRRLLWVGDAVVSTGFARGTHKILDVLKETWDVDVLGINYLGDPHPYPYRIWPCYPGGDPFGIGRVKDMVDTIKPDMIVLQNDPWNIPAYMKEIETEVPIVAILPVDGKNCRGDKLNGLACGVFWTQFGAEEAKLGGFAQRAEVIPLGVDPTIYRPMDRTAARQAVLPGKAFQAVQEGFLVGNINRNQPRKRLDLTVKFFAEWVKEKNIEDAFLVLHVAPTGDSGYDCAQLMHYYGLKRRLILLQPNVGMGVTEQEVAATYNMFDVQMTTTQGEGWGLTTLEGMACGVPQIVPVWSALADWTGNAAVRIHCDTTITTHDRINVVGGVPCQRPFQAALDNFYRDATLRATYRERGIQLASQTKYQWPEIGKRFGKVLDSVASERQQEGAA